MRKVLYILGQLSDDDIEWLIANGQQRQLDRGAVLIQEGQPVEALYIVLDGLLVVSAAENAEIARLGAGEIIGEISFVDSRPPSATVTVLQPSIVFALDRAQLYGKADRFEHRCYHLSALVLLRNRQLAQLRFDFRRQLLNLTCFAQ